MRTGDLLARIGDAEFVAVLANLDPLDAARVADRAARDILADVRRPFTSGAVQTTARCSVGVSIFPDSADNGEPLLAMAIAAKGEAKRSGGGAVRFASPQADGGGAAQFDPGTGRDLHLS
jgi:GGDEF domain-containing protein